MNDFTQNSVADLRKILIQSGKYTEEEANNIKGKSNLIEHVLKLDNGQDYSEALSKAQFEQPSNDVKIVPIEDKTTEQNIEWHEYVMSHFTKDELVDDKYPTLVGLRRVSELLIGSIFESGPLEIFPASEQNNHRVTCLYKVVFNRYDGPSVIFRASADACNDNLEHPYNKYPTCIAENRAEARTLRRALKIKVAAAEEVAHQDELKSVEVTSTGEWKESDPISEQQILSIKKKCKDCSIDLQKFINCGDFNYEDLTKITRGIAQKMLQRLNEYQSKTQQSVEIPTEIKL